MQQRCYILYTVWYELKNIQEKITILIPSFEFLMYESSFCFVECFITCSTRCINQLRIFLYFEFCRAFSQASSIFFLDEVTLEQCWRVLNSGFKVVSNNYYFSTMFSPLLLGKWRTAIAHQRNIQQRFLGRPLELLIFGIKFESHLVTQSL
jgi:hypothetical protein